MRIKDSYICTRAVALDKERLTELETILLKYCSQITYETTDQSKQIAKYNSIDELVCGDNFGQKKVRILDIHGTGDNQNKLHVRFNCYRIRPLIDTFRVFECEYELSDKQEQFRLIDDLILFSKKARVGYWLFAKMRLFDLYVFALVVVAAGAEYFGWPDMVRTLENLGAPKALTGTLFISCTYRTLVLLGTMAAVAIVDSCVFNPIMLKLFFPPVNFLWGEEIRFYNKRKNLRNQIVWGVLIALCVSLLSALLYDYLKTWMS